MLSQKTVSKNPLIWLLVAQAICLAFGLWIQDRLVAFSAHTQTLRTNAEAAVGSPSALPGKVEVLEKLPITQIFVFFWIFGMQGGVAYLILSRAHSEDSQRQARLRPRRYCAKRSGENAECRDFRPGQAGRVRDPETGRHLERIAHFSTRFANALRRLPKYRAQAEMRKATYGRFRFR